MMTECCTGTLTKNTNGKNKRGIQERKPRNTIRVKDELKETRKRKTEETGIPKERKSFSSSGIEMSSEFDLCIHHMYSVTLNY
jgi:hypothetical protein